MKLPTHVIKLTEGYSTRQHGTCFELYIDGKHVFAFPDKVDEFDFESLDYWWPTYLYPKEGMVDDLAYFFPGPRIPGWDLLGAYRGPVGYSPAMEVSTAPEQFKLVSFPQLHDRAVRTALCKGKGKKEKNNG